MANSGPSNEQSLQVNATTILALLTLLGGILIAAHKLTSDRPIAPPGEANPPLSEERVGTRLWEDPLGHTGNIERTNKALIGNLPGEMKEPQNKNFRILAVMTPGGPASEYRERRIRDRFAIVSALAESEYAPRNNSHIGVGMMPWPTTLVLSENIRTNSTNISNPESLKGFYHTAFADLTYFAFEWYDREHFLQPNAATATNDNPVLVLWLDEDQFQDYPIARLDLFLRKLGDTCLPGTSNLRTSTRVNYRYVPETNETWITDNIDNHTNHQVLLIGPGRSDTLKSIFATNFLPANRAAGISLGNERTNITKKSVSLFLAVPRVIDQILIKTDHYDERAPRELLLQNLSNYFNEALNFAMTDAELAHAVNQELMNRGIDLSVTNENNLVLINVWDDYFGRMLSGAYAAEMLGTNVDQEKFFRQYNEGQIPDPTNFFKFYFLSGLDGQGLSRRPKGEADSSGNRDDTPIDVNISGEPRATRWTPDESRAEGTAQYDYLVRLGTRISRLNDRLLREGRGSIKVILIGSGDVYDTLLLLQALRPRFPDALFITTILDARFWDPKEWEWSRNLIVVSGYGLAVNEDTQQKTPPFRDSLQTAEFAAALRALGNTNIPPLANGFPIRCFEIGRYGPITLTTDEIASGHHLHPVQNTWQGWSVWFAQKGRGLAVIVVLLGTCGLLLGLSSKFRRLTIHRFQMLAEPLWLREEDIGGLDGFYEMTVKLEKDLEESDGNAGKEKPTDPLHELRKQAGRNLARRAERAEHEMDKALEEQNSDAIFTDADILNPNQLVTILHDEADDTIKKLSGIDTKYFLFLALQENPAALDNSLSQLDKQTRAKVCGEKDLEQRVAILETLIESSKDPAQDDQAIKGLAAECERLKELRKNETKRIIFKLQKQLSPSIFRALEEWKESQPQSNPQMLSLIVEALREILTRTDFSNLSNLDPTPPKAARLSKSRWRHNRQLLWKALRGVVRPPANVFPFMPEEHKKYGDWRLGWQAAVNDSTQRESLQVYMLQVLQDWNSQWKGESNVRGDSRYGEEEVCSISPWDLIPYVETHHDLYVLKAYRERTNCLIAALTETPPSSSGAGHGSQESYGWETAAGAARAVSGFLFGLFRLRWWWLCLTLVATFVSSLGMFWVELRDPASQTWQITGASLWPANWLYLLAVLLGLMFIIESYFQLRAVGFETTRECRLNYPKTLKVKPISPLLSLFQRTLSWMRRMYLPSGAEPLAVVNADEAWEKYQLQGRGAGRFCRTVFLSLAYLLVFFGVYQLIFGYQYHPAFRSPAGDWYTCLAYIAFGIFIFLSFWTIDAAFLCRWFIIRITQGPTLYSIQTRQHFARKRGDVPLHVLSEWIDVSVIAEITERVGMLIYFPSFIFLLVLLGNNSLFYYFPWPPSYYIMASCNMVLAAISIVILQRAARKARHLSMSILEDKLNQLKGSAVVTQAEKRQHDIIKTQELLNDIRSLKKGAFGGFWENPVVGALLVPSGGTALIEIIKFFMR